MRSNIIYIILALLLAVGGKVNAQAINWKNAGKQNTHVISLRAGLEHGTLYSIGYGYKINEKLFPVFLSADISVPSGDKLFDDFKTRLGGNIQWLNYRDFRFSTNLYSVFRRYQNDFVRMANFGCDLSGVIGYYHKKWFAATEIGFDKAIVTHFKHSELYKAQYPGVVNGWYEPSTGGNFYYGLQAGYSFGKSDLWIKAGKTVEQDFKTKPIVPMYGQLGFNLKF